MRSRQDGRPVCEHCGLKGHTGRTCNRPEGIKARGGYKYDPPARFKTKPFNPPVKSDKEVDDDQQ